MFVFFLIEDNVKVQMRKGILDFTKGKTLQQFLILHCAFKFPRIGESI